MKAEAIKEYFIVNGKLKNTNDLEIFNRIEKSPIYEVLRIIDGVPLFLEEHLNRMFDSANLLNYEMDKSEKDIRSDIKSIILNNNVEKSNIKLLSTDVDGMGKIFLIYCIESFYPPDEYYINGIHTTLFNHERENPNAKVLFTSFKDDVNKIIKQNNAFEALLVSKTGYIPEGSRSNMFFVKNDNLYTAPESEVLIGITRKHIFNVCERLNIEIIEESIHIDDLNKIDGAFMSGTSVNVLPISTIDEIKLDSMNNEIIVEINNSYINGIENYILQHKEEWV